MRATMIAVNGERTAVEGTETQVDGFFADLDAAGEVYEREVSDFSPDAPAGTKTLRLNGKPVERVERFRPVTQGGRMTANLETTRGGTLVLNGIETPPGGSTFGHGPDDGLDMPSTRPEAATNYLGRGFSANGVTDNAADDDGLDLPTTFDPRAYTGLASGDEPTDNAAPLDDDEGLDLPSTRY